MDAVTILEEIYNVSISAKAKDDFANICIPKTYKKDEIILNLGEVCINFLLVKDGIIRMFYYKDGRDITEHFHVENELAFAIESVFQKRPTDLMIEALEDCLVYEINYNQLLLLVEKHTDIGVLYRRILELDLVLTQRKADSWRFESSKERYERFCIEYPEVVRRASIAQIATYLLMTPETLSRVRAGLL